MRLLLDTTELIGVDSIVLVSHNDCVYVARFTSWSSELTSNFFDGGIQALCTTCDENGDSQGDQTPHLVPMSAIVGVVMGSYEVAGDTDGAA